MKKEKVNEKIMNNEREKKKTKKESFPLHLHFC